MKYDAAARDEHVTRLALAAGGGDRRALTEFIKATQDDVWRLIAHLGGADIADDLTQETFLRAMKSLPKFKAQASARTWLLAIARRTWVDNIRHDMARPRKSATEIEDAAAERPALSSGEAQWSQMMDVKMLLDALPEERREALVLTQVLGYSYEEAARIAGVRVGTIRSRVARARKDLIEGS